MIKKLKYLFVFFLVFPLTTFGAITNYVRTPSGTPITGTSVEVSFDYAGSDSNTFSKTGLFLFDNTNAKIACIAVTVISNVGGNIDQTFTGLSDGQVYSVKWGKIDQSAPSYDICGNITTTTNFASVVDGSNVLESGTPSFVIDNSSGGGGSSSTEATSTIDTVQMIVSVSIIEFMLAFCIMFYLLKNI